MSNRTINISAIVLVVLFALTAAARFAVQAVASPVGYGIRRGVEGFRGQMGPGMMGGFQAPMAYGHGWFQALTSFGMWVIPVMLLGLLIVALAPFVIWAGFSYGWVSVLCGAAEALLIPCRDEYIGIGGPVTFHIQTRLGRRTVEFILR